MGWWVCRGLNVSDNALYGKVIVLAPTGEACGRSWNDRFLVPRDAFRRGNAFGYEPVRLKSRRAESCML